MTPPRAEQQALSPSRAGPWLWIGPLLYVLAVGLYFLARFGGHWSEANSATFVKILRTFVGEERLVPALGPVYPNGYAFQAISAYIVALAGIDVATLQQLIYPLVAVILVLPAWVAYRELAGSARGAALATMLLLIQPEFLFVILRSSHEKFTRTLMLLCVFLLARSLKLRGQPRLLATYVALFYLAVFALIASNNLLAHSFVFAVAVAAVLGRLLGSRLSSRKEDLPYVVNRFLYISLTCLIIVYIFIFYVYPPALHDVIVLRSTWERVAALLLDVQSQADRTYTDAYGAVTSGWINVRVYFLVSLANWIVLATSLGIWLYSGARWFWRGEAPEARAWLVWLLYAAFAVQGALSVVADASGALTGNLQHRLFPSVSIWSAALVGMALDRWQPQRFAPALRTRASGWPLVPQRPLGNEGDERAHAEQQVDVLPPDGGGCS